MSDVQHKQLKVPTNCQVIFIDGTRETFDHEVNFAVVGYEYPRVCIIELEGIEKQARMSLELLTLITEDEQG